MEIQWPLLIFGVLAGLSMGCFGYVCAFVLAGRAERLRLPGTVVSLAALLVGGAASAFHMGNPDRILYILGNLQSGITQELLAAAAAFVLVAAMGIALWKKASGGVLKTIAVLGLIISVVLPFITGDAYMQGARPAWNTWALPFMYVVAAFAMGSFAMYLASLALRAENADVRLLGKASFIAAIAFAVAVGLYIAAVAVAPFPEPSRSVERVLSGDLAALFWLVVVIAGIAVPIALSGIYALKSRSAAPGKTVALANPTIVLAGFACLLAGSVAIRAIMYLLGSSVQSFIY